WAAYAGANAYFEISESISTKLRELAKQLKVSLYSLLLAGYYLMLRVYSNQNDIVIGIPIANRHYNQIDNLIGFFVNTLALRTKIEPLALVRKYIQEIGREIIEAQLHQDLPFEKLVEELEVGKDTSRHPIFQVVFAMEGPDQKTQQQTYEPPKSSLINSLQPYTLKRNMHTVAKFDLSTFIDDNQISLKGCFNYAESLYTKVTVSRYIKTYTEILNKLSNLANNIKKQEQMKISDLSYLNEMQHHQIIYKWNETEKAFPEDKTLQKLFEEQAEQTPNNIAVVHNKIYLTYKELNERANQLANYVKILYELKPDTLIVICLDKSEFMLIAILGVLKAGGAYVPVDPTDPDERLHYILKDTSTKIILTNTKYKRRFERILSKGNNLKNREVDEGVGKEKQQLATILELDESELQEILLMQSKNNPETTVSSDLLAYVIYTSGTTGIPKGAMIEHKSTISLIKNVAYINITSKDTFIQ
ncbi:MAG: AMP-binding protein, partial [Alphaproteobacteria bacterium]|nr:AMP-binding protein [Alphaproteobacteria bacterium]